MAQSRRSARRPVALFLGVIALSCDFAERTPAVLQIIEPLQGTTFNDASDQNPDIEGTQISVRVEGEGDGHTIVLSRLLGDAPRRLSTAELEGGSALFSPVTLLAGPNVLQAEDAATGRTSLPLTVYLSSPCRSIEIIEPKTDKTAKELVLGPGDDRDGTPCGDGFSVRLIAATGLPDGSSVTLLADDLPLLGGTTRGGVLDLDTVPLGEAVSRLGTQSFTLTLRVADSQCGEVAFATPVRIDCEGPMLCQIASLGVDDVLNALADMDALLPGVQLPVSVQTDDEARGQPVELVINDDQLDPLSATVDLEEPVATFARVSLPEGDVRLDAICYDAVDNQTRSARRTVYVDSLGCPITITSPQVDATFTPGEGQSSVDVALTASFQGGDCVKTYRAVASDESCAGLFAGEPESLAVGQTTITQTFTLEGEGSRALCVGIVDMHGNPSQAAVRVSLGEAPTPDAGVSDGGP